MASRGPPPGVKPLSLAAPRELPPPLPLLPPKPVTARAIEAKNALGRRVRSVQHSGECPSTPEPIADVERCWQLQDFYEQAELLPCSCAGPHATEVAYDCSSNLLAGDSDGDDDSDDSDGGNKSARKARHASKLGREEGCAADTLLFDSMFESGNLRRAERVYGRGQCPHWLGMQQREAPELLPCDQEYDLWAREDIHTKGNIQWFYFAVRNTKALQRVRFTIVNNNKSDSLFNYGMKPLVYSEHRAAYEDISWTREGEDICYYQSATQQPSRGRRARKKMFYKFTFTYTFKHSNDVVYFAYTFPYTYTDLQRYLFSLESNPRCRSFLRRKTLCQTLAGNTVDVLTITASTSNPADLRRRKAVVISARVHPGETNASLMMHGVLKFLTGNSPEAQLLRANLVFKIVPMLNPDGVVSGNYRCSLAGVDLNRRWGKPSRKLHAPIFAIKSMIKRLSQQRTVALFCDLHGHSRKYNIFVYGCAPKRGSPKERGRPRIFPHLLYRQSPSKPQEDYDYTRVHTVLDRLASEDASGAGGGTSNGSGSKAPARGGTNSGVSGSGGGSGGSGGGVRAPWSSSTVVPRRANRNAVEQFPLSPEPMGVELEASMGHDNSTGRFSFVDCRFNVHPSKKGTGRVVCWRELHVANAFTMEASFCGTGDCSIIDKRSKYVKRRRRWLRKKIDNLEELAALATPTSTSSGRPAATNSRLTPAPLLLRAAGGSGSQADRAGRPPRPDRRTGASRPASAADASRRTARVHSGGSPAAERGSVAALVANAVDAMHRSSTPDPSTARRQRSSDSSDPGTPSDGAVAPISGASSRRSSDAEDDPDGDDGDDGYSSDSNEDEEDDDDEDGAAKTEVDEEDDDDLESGAQQGDDEDTLDDFVNRGGARASGGGGTSRKDGADTTSDADNNDGIGDDGGVDDELDRPRVPTHFTARDLMAQGRALCHVLVRLCNLQASGTHKLHLQRMVVPGGPSGLPAGSPPQHRAQSRLLMAAAGELLASPITPKPGSTFGTSGGGSGGGSGGAVAGDGTRAPAASPRSPSEASGGEGGVIGAVVGGELLADVEVELDDTQLADSAAEEDLLMEVMAQVNVSESEEDSEGSESDPSGDNLDEAALKRTSTFKKLIGEPKKTKKKRRKARKGGRRTRPWLSKKTGKKKSSKSKAAKASDDDSATDPPPRRTTRRRVKRDTTPIQIRRNQSAAELNKDNMWRLSRPLPWANPYDVHEKAVQSRDASTPGPASRRSPASHGDGSTSSRHVKSSSGKRAGFGRSSSSGSLSHLGTAAGSSPRTHRGHGRSSHAGATPRGGSGGGSGSGSGSGTSTAHRRRHHSEKPSRSRSGRGSSGVSGEGGNRIDQRAPRTARGDYTRQSSRRALGFGSGGSGGGSGSSSLPNVGAASSVSARHALVPRMFTASFDGEAPRKQHPVHMVRKKGPPMPLPARASATNSPVRFSADRDFAPLQSPGTSGYGGGGGGGGRRVRSATTVPSDGRALASDPSPTRFNFRGDPPLGGVPMSPDPSPPGSPRVPHALSDYDASQRFAAVHGLSPPKGGGGSALARHPAARQFGFVDPCASPVLAVPGNALPFSPGSAYAPSHTGFYAASAPSTARGSGSGSGGGGGGGGVPPSWTDMEVTEYVMRHNLAPSEVHGRPRLP